MEQRITCAICGEVLDAPENGYRKCRYCGASYAEKEAEDSYRLILDALGQEKQERLAAARKLLYVSTHAEYPSSSEISDNAHSLLLLSPDDPQARFYEAAVADSPSRLNNFLTSVSVDHHLAKEILDWMEKSMELKNFASVKGFISRHYSGAEAVKETTRFENEAEKLEEGIYSPSIKRDVFVAYSSADQRKVEEIVSMLEEESFTCFVAFRNMRHGKGAEERYIPILREAMHNCSTFLFISSKNSRSLSCDALDKEIPYAMEHEQQMNRIEYVIDDIENTRVPLSVKLTLKDFFNGLEWCRDEEDLIGRLLKFRRSKSSYASETKKPSESEEILKRFEEERKKLEEERLAREREFANLRQNMAAKEAEEKKGVTFIIKSIDKDRFDQVVAHANLLFKGKNFYQTSINLKSLPSIVPNSLSYEDAVNYAKALSHEGAEIEIREKGSGAFLSSFPIDVDRKSLYEFVYVDLEPGAVRADVTKKVVELLSFSALGSSPLSEKRGQALMSFVTKDLGQLLYDAFIAIGGRFELQDSPVPVTHEGKPALYKVELTFVRRQIATMKAIQNITNLGLMDSKRMCDNLPSTVARGLDKKTADIYLKELQAADAEAKIVPDIEEAKPAPTKSTADVIIKSCKSKVEAIKMLMQLDSSLSLLDAKRCIDASPMPVLKNVDMAFAKSAAEKFTKIGCEVEIQ